MSCERKLYLYFSNKTSQIAIDQNIGNYKPKDTFCLSDTHTKNPYNDKLPVMCRRQRCWRCHYNWFRSRNVWSAFLSIHMCTHFTPYPYMHVSPEFMLAKNQVTLTHVPLIPIVSQFTHSCNCALAGNKTPGYSNLRSLFIN